MSGIVFRLYGDRLKIKNKQNLILLYFLNAYHNMNFIDSYEIKHVDMSWVIDNKQYGSLNHPTVMIGDDNESYQVKFNKPDDMRIGINELVCNLIGLELELPMFESIIASISQELIDSNEKLSEFCPGDHFAQVYLQPFETVNSYKIQGKTIDKDMIGNFRQIPDFIIFDKYIENFDRHENNICLLENEKLTDKVDYYLFDHDLAFQRNPNIKTDIRGLREMKRTLHQMHFVVDHIDKFRLFDRGINRTIDLANTIPDIIKKIPTSWKNGYEEYINNVEILLTEFTKNMANEHIQLNRDKLSSLQ